MSKIKIGLAGYGYWPRVAYVPALTRDGRAEVVAAAAATSRTRERIRQDLGERVRLFADYEEMLDFAQFDAALIAVPDQFHEAAIMAAIKAGRPFLYEPPVANRIDRVPHVLNALLSASQITHADIELRFLPVVRYVAGMVARGDVGAPRIATVTAHGNWPPAPEIHLCLVHSIAPWYLDVLNLVLGRLPRRIMVQDGRESNRRLQPYAIAELDYGTCWGIFRARLLAVGGPEMLLEIHGSEGDLLVDVFGGRVELRTRKAPEWSMAEHPPILPWAGWPGMHESISAFLDAVVSGTPSVAGPSAIAQGHRIGLAAEQSVDSDAWADVTVV